MKIHYFTVKMQLQSSLRDNSKNSQHIVSVKFTPTMHPVRLNKKRLMAHKNLTKLISIIQNHLIYKNKTRFTKLLPFRVTW